MALYVIRDWAKHFESFESARVKKLNWIAMPIKHDGKTFRRIMRRDPTGRLFGAWCLIVQVAAKCPVRGTLADGDGPLTAEDISDKTGLSVECAQQALTLFSSEEIRWIEDSQQEKASPSKEQDKEEQERTGQAAVVPAEMRADAVVPADVHNCNGQEELKLNEQPYKTADDIQAAINRGFIFKNNGGTHYEPPSDEFLRWWGFLPPGMKSSQDECWEYWPTVIVKIMAKHKLDATLAAERLMHRTRLFSSSARGKSSECVMSPVTFLKRGNYDDEIESWEAVGVEKKTGERKPRIPKIVNGRTAK